MPLKTRLLLLFYTSILVFFVQLNTIAQDIDTIVPINKNPEKLLKRINIKSVTQNGFNLWQDKFKGHYAGIDFGFNTLLDANYDGYETEFMKNDILFSNSVFINFFQKSFGLQQNRNTIGIVAGLSFAYQGYRLDKHTTIKKLPNGKIIPKKINYNENQKSKLTIYSVFLPVLAEFQVPIQSYKNRLYFSGGIYFAYRLGSNTKITYRDEKREHLRVPGDYSLQDFKYGLMFRTGYRRVNLFASYELLPLVKEKKGPHLTPFTFGITLLGF